MAKLNSAKTHIEPLADGEAVFTVSTTTPNVSKDVTITVRTVAGITLSDVKVPVKNVYGVMEPFPIPEGLTYTKHYLDGTTEDPKLVTPAMIAKKANGMVPWSIEDTGSTKELLYVYDTASKTYAPLSETPTKVSNFILDISGDLSGYTDLKSAVINAMGRTGIITQYTPEENVFDTIGPDPTPFITEITLKGAGPGKKIIQGNNRSIFELSGANVLSSTVAIMTMRLGENITLVGRTAALANENTAPVVHLNGTNVNFIMENGSKITGWSGGSGSGNGALYVQAGIASINGGEITGNKNTFLGWNGTSIVVVYARPGGKLVMNGGSIKGNSDKVYINDVLLLVDPDTSDVLTLGGNANIEKLGVVASGGVITTGRAVRLDYNWETIPAPITLNLAADVSPAHMRNFDTLYTPAGGIGATQAPVLFYYGTNTVNHRSMGFITPGKSYYSADVTTGITPAEIATISDLGIVIFR